MSNYIEKNDFAKQFCERTLKIYEENSKTDYDVTLLLNLALGLFVIP